MGAISKWEGVEPTDKGTCFGVKYTGDLYALFVVKYLGFVGQLVRKSG